MATLPTNSLRTLTETLIFNAFRVLKENEREMKGSELMRRVGEISELPAWAEERLEKTGNVRWQSVLHLQSITAVKAGFLVKKKGVWYLTEEGAVAMKDGAEKLFQRCKDGYAKWKANESGLGTDDITKEVESTGVPPEATAATFSEREAESFFLAGRLQPQTAVLQSANSGVHAIRLLRSHSERTAHAYGAHSGNQS